MIFAAVILPAVVRVWNEIQEVPRWKGKGGSTMDEVLRCTDTGLDCNFVICGQTKDEVLNNARDHMKDFHKKEFSKDLYEKARNAIHEGDCEKEIQINQILVF